MQNNSTSMAVAQDDEVDARTRRAAEQVMQVIPDDPKVSHDDDLFMVVSGSGSTYGVHMEDGNCTCPDHVQRQNKCKHIRRVEFETGQETVPAGLETDEMMGYHTDAEVRQAASDGGHK